MKINKLITILGLWSMVACAEQSHNGPVASTGNNTPAAGPVALAPVTTVIVNGVQILADRNGLSVYTFDVDVTAESKCYDDCAVKWPPVLLQAGETTSAPFGTTTRKDGTTQLTIDGHPLYLFFLDKASGDIKGDNVGNVWHLVPFN